MNKRNITKFLSVMLVAILVVMAMPFAASAASEVTQITSMSDLVSGQKYVIATAGTNMAMTSLSGSWIYAQAVTPESGKITGVTDDILWTITVSGTSAKLTDSNNVSIAPSGGNANGIKSGNYSWAVTCTDGKFTFSGTGDDTVALASNKGSSGNFRAYKRL